MGLDGKVRPNLGGWRPAPRSKKRGGGVECRVCLEPTGEIRGCCEEPLCQHCWSHAGFCPRCGVELKMVNMINVQPKPGENIRAMDSKKPVIVGKEDAENEGATSPLPEDDPAAEATQCTVCLAPGFMRKCCGEFYCNDCFFRNRVCPGCGAPAVSKGFSYEVKDPGACALALGWFVTHSIWLSALLVVFLVSFDEAHRRSTVSGFKCYKYMGACDRHACVTLNNSLPPVLQDLNDWAERCDSATSVNKARGQACVFDMELFRRTNHRLGYDFCHGRHAKDDSNMGGLHGRLGMVGGEYNGRGAKFNGGAYVFEDDFDAWSGVFNERDIAGMPYSTTYGSALWHNATNAASSSKCGSVSGDHSLRFSGKATRAAETKALDLRYGGWASFHLKFGPNPGTEDCDTALIGEVDLFWAAETKTGALAMNWTKWDTFVPYEYPTDGTWTLVTRELPVEAHSPGTRIMFKQSVFVAMRDHFAIDDLVVWHKFEKGWHGSEHYQAQWAESRARMGIAQCCLGSAQCEHRMSPAEKEAECADVPGFVPGYDSFHEPMNNTSPFFIGLAAVIFFAKFVYSCGNLAIAQYAGHEKDFDPTRPPQPCCGALRACGSLKRHASAKIYNLDEGPPAHASLERRFYVEDDRGWRWRFLLLWTLLPWLCTWLWSALIAEDVYVDVLRKLHTDGPGTSNGNWVFLWPVHLQMFLGAAAILDLWPLWVMARQVVCTGARSDVPTVDLDARPSRPVFQLSGPSDYEEISLKDFKTKRWVSPKEMNALAALCIIGVSPWASSALLCHLLRLPWALSRGLLPFLGTGAIARAYAGGSWPVKLYLWLQWLFSNHIDDRNEIGMVSVLRRTRTMVVVATLFAFVCGSVFLLLVDISATWKTALFLGIITVGGGHWGLLCSIGHGLPIEPRLLLTSLKAPALMLRYEHHSHYRFPGVGPRWCRHPDRHVCVDVHSRDRVLILAVDDNQGLYEMIKGMEQPEVSDF